MKTFTKKAILGTGLILGLTAGSFAQTPLSGFMQGKKGGGVSFSLTHENYKKVFLFPEVDRRTLLQAATRFPNARQACSAPPNALPTIVSLLVLILLPLARS